MCVLSHFRTCDVRAEVRAERGLQLCVVYACVRLVFGRAMCDHTFAHFLEQKQPNNAIIGQRIFTFRKSYPILEHHFLFLNIISCFRTSFSVLERPFLF